MMFKSLVIYFITTLFVELYATPPSRLIDIDILSKQAKKEHKHLLLFFHKSGCGFCKKMRSVTLDNAATEAFINKHFIFVDIGIDDEGSVKHKDFKGSNHAYAKFLEISFYPTVGFVDGNNSLVYGVIGYRGVDSFVKVLKYIESRSYKVMDLEDFKTKLDFENDE